MALQAPIDRDTHRSLRAAVLAHRQSERRRWFPVTLHGGTIGAATSLVHHTEDPHVPHDAGLRIDVALGLLQHVMRRPGRPLVWMTRPGELSVHDADLVWGAAVRHAATAAGLVPGDLVVVTRRGWFDPVSGVRREWLRLRGPRGPAPADPS